VAIFWPLGFECEFDLSGVRALQEDMLKKSQTAQSLITSGVMTPDEVRSKLFDMKPLPADYKNPYAPQAPMFSPIVQSATPILKATSIDPAQDKIETVAEEAMFEEMKKIFDDMFDTSKGAIK